MLLAVAMPSAARAQAPTNAPDWAFGAPGGEAAVLAVSIASLSAFFLPQRHGSWAPDAPRAFHPGYDAVSNFTGAYLGTLEVAAVGYVFEGAHLAGAGTPQPWARALRTSLVDVEAVALSSGLVQAIKRAVGRCRPRSWEGDHCRDRDEDHDAFPSGHVAPVASLAGAHMALAFRTDGPAGLRVASLGVAEGATLATAMLRVLAGAHSTSDVMTSFVLGHAVGALIGVLHPMVAPAGVGGVASPGAAPAAFGWSGAF
jgi:membrane-associated phospholipid phosphatase